ncbi:hypothetical protein QWY90_13055 [Flavobacterium paronense]|uniref:Uncharacterized protein n=1 Tax=Flavobacterium paronense TaxID=1392775 RepID=A0ABV5GED8_9FLAO|nr:hypothetical protein [Flavobacterium paronense]MDN3678236.1 hypothetical protein [Flavobacterium paronense]
MARINKKGQIIGSIGPVSFRAYNGKEYLQGKPGKKKMKQTVATKKSASDFGRGSRLAKAIREALFPILQNRGDANFYRRFTTKINTATQDGNSKPIGSRTLMEGNLDLLQNIDCNLASPFVHYCKLSPTLSLSGSCQLTIALPEFSVLDYIAQKEKATHAELVFLVTALPTEIDPENPIEPKAELFRLAFPLKASVVPAQQWTTVVLPEGQLIVVASALFYYRDNALAGMVGLNGKEFHPVEVSAVLK